MGKQHTHNLMFLVHHIVQLLEGGISTVVKSHSLSLFKVTGPIQLPLDISDHFPQVTSLFLFQLRPYWPSGVEGLHREEHQGRGHQ